jgi:hypothetical protein
LEVLKAFYYTLCQCGVVVDGKLAVMVLVILLAWNLDVQQGLFKLNIKSNVAQTMAKVVALTIDKAHPMGINPFTHL